MFFFFLFLLLLFFGSLAGFVAVWVKNKYFFSSLRLPKDKKAKQHILQSCINISLQLKL